MEKQAGEDPENALRRARRQARARRNGLRGMMLCCPLTLKLKGYPFEVVISQSPPGAVLVDQLKSLDWRACKARHKGRVTVVELADVRAKLKALLQI